MKQIKFSPLRRIKKTGKIAVASYRQWRKIKTADYSHFQLIINETYKMLPLDEYVYNHKGELLYWRDYSPSNIPVHSFDVMKLFNNFDNLDDNKVFFAELSKESSVLGYGVISGVGGSTYFNCKGLDCDGVPVFSNNTEHELINGYSLDAVEEFSVLTVRMVVKWFGWFLYQLENSRIEILK